MQQKKNNTTNNNNYTVERASDGTGDVPSRPSLSGHSLAPYKETNNSAACNEGLHPEEPGFGVSLCCLWLLMELVVYIARYHTTSCLAKGAASTLFCLCCSGRHWA
mmetsp:Transcript_4368/g.8032  ORF Transcript_4368/g.8032 Transcript_4368/m.8032 type:complete len:106 (+) Transcript_4368:2736-3053(+)